MSSHAATRKLGAILASIVVSSYALFGHDAWAPEPAVLTQYLGLSSGATAAAVTVHTLESTEVLMWPGTWTSGSHAVLAMTGEPCSTTYLAEGMIADQFLARIGNHAKCTMWVNDGARLKEGQSLSGTLSTAQATIISGETAGADTDVVQFPAAWTYNTTLAAETYCATWPASAGQAVGSIIVRSGDYAKCSF